MAKQIFEIEISEQLARVERIEAETLGDAIDIAMKLYREEKVVLDAEDMKGVDFQPLNQVERTERGGIR